MKITEKLILGFALISAMSAFNARAQSSERAITVAFTGYLQSLSTTGSDLAMPFRVATKDLLDEIGFATGTNLINGKLFLVQDSINDTNASLRVIARDASNTVEVTDFFEIEPGTNFVDTVTTSTTIYAIDAFHFFTTNVDVQGIDLTFQGLSKESQRNLLAKIGTNKVPVLSTSVKSTGIGELRKGNNVFVGPLKGTVTIAAPKFYP
jgi:hypothetical protein